MTSTPVNNPAPKPPFTKWAACEDSPITAEEFAVILYRLGLTAKKFGAILEIGERTVKARLSGRDYITAWSAARITRLVEVHNLLVEAMVSGEQTVLIQGGKGPEGGWVREWYVAAFSRASQIRPDLKMCWAGYCHPETPEKIGDTLIHDYLNENLKPQMMVDKKPLSRQERR